MDSRPHDNAQVAETSESAPGPGRVRWFLEAGWIDRAKAEADYWRRVPIDRFGDPIHLILACFYALVIGGPISYMESGLLFPLGCFLVRLPFIWRGVWRVFLTPLPMAMMAWAGWSALALLWSEDPAQGWDEVDWIRFLATSLVLWPVVHHRRAIIVFLTIGFLCGNIAQVVSLAALESGAEWAKERFVAGWRVGGWWPQNRGAEMLVAVLGLHLPVVLMGRGAWRIYAAIGVLATITGIFATGSRGPMLASAGLVVFACVFAVARLKTWRQRARVMVIVGVVAAGATAIGVGFFGDVLRQRATAARDELVRAVNQRDYDSDNGLRVAMLLWAWEAFREHPIAGLGAGGFRTYVGSHPAGREVAQGRFMAQDQTMAHNAIAHEAACTGIVGLSLFVLVLTLAIRNAAAIVREGEWGTYDAGPFFGLIGMVLLMPFDAIQIQSQPACVMFMLCALSPWWRPRRGEGVTASAP